MEVHLIDGTYELFRHHAVLPSEVAATSRGAATRGVMRSVLDLLAAGATHVGVATDTVIESFRNDLWPGYKTGAGVDPVLLDQFPLVERALEALGVTVWPMREVEADDALATAAARAAEDPRVTRVLVCTPDKDLAQCVAGVGGPARPPRRDRARRGRRARAVRRRAGVDPRLPRPGGRLRRRLPRASPDGARRARPPCWPATSTWRRSPTTRRSGT